MVIRNPQALEGELQCPVCVSIFDTPVTLSCTHHICKTHISNLAKNNVVSCPVCKASTKVSDDNVLPVDTFLDRICGVWSGKLKPDFVPNKGKAEKTTNGRAPCGLCGKSPALNYCCTCRAEICKECLRSRHSDGFFQSHDLHSFENSIDFVTQTVFCDQHEGEKLNLYCVDCHLAVCAHCLLTGQHIDHKRLGLADAYNKEFEDFENWDGKLQSLNSQLADFIDTLATLDVEIERNEKQQRDQIESEIAHLKEILEAKRVQLLSKSELEAKRKRSQNEGQSKTAQKDRAVVQKVLDRNSKLKIVQSQHTFLGLYRALKTDVQTETQQSRCFAPATTSIYRNFNTEEAQGSLGELDLGAKEKKIVKKEETRSAEKERTTKQAGKWGGARPATYVSQPTQMIVNAQSFNNGFPPQFLPTTQAAVPQRK